MFLWVTIIKVISLPISIAIIGTLCYEILVFIFEEIITLYESADMIVYNMVDDRGSSYV